MKQIMTTILNIRQKLAMCNDVDINSIGKSRLSVNLSIVYQA